MNPRIALTSFLAGILMISAAPSADAGIAIAIATHKDRSLGRDVKYFIRHDSTSTGTKMATVARKDFKKAYESKKRVWNSYPTTRNSSDLKTGEFVVLRYEFLDSKKVRNTVYALGFGATAKLAKAEAVKELGRRNWNWVKKDGYRVDRSGSF